MVHDASAQFLRGRDHGQHRLVLSRAFTHSVMKAACNAAIGGTLPGFGALDIPADLKVVAQAFVDLQEKRHTADYDLATMVTKTEATNDVEQAEKAFEVWQRVRGKKVARLFLVSLMAHEQLRRR